MGYWTAQDWYTTSGPIKWRVLDTKTNTGESGLFLLSDVLLGTAYFNKTTPTSKAWQGSDAQAWCKDFAGEEGAAANVPNAFTADELSAILATTKSDALCPIYDVGDITIKFVASNGILNGDRVFFLSGEEAINANYGFNPNGYTEDNARKAFYNGAAKLWWLRSPSNRTTARVGVVDISGYVGLGSVSSDKWALRPAFNLDLNSVLFTSAANNGGHNSSFAAPAVYTDSEWKVTLKDGNRFDAGASVSGTTTVVEGYAATELTITHKALSEISADYTNVTAMLTDENGDLLYYGSINNSTSATSSTVTIPAGLTEGKYTLSVYGEDWNEAKRTDYATGTPFTTTITVHKHSWDTNTWEYDVAGHWHPCTDECPVTVNSEKYGYAVHSASNTGNCVCGFNPLTVTVSQSPASYTYGDAGVTLSAAVIRSDDGSTEGATYAWSDSSTNQTLTLTGLNAGDHAYTCTITTVDGYKKTSEAFNVSVGKAASFVTTPPTAATGPTYTGQPQALLTAGGTANGGTMQYSLEENGTYSTDFPQGTDANTYTVYYKVVGDDNHNDSAPASLTVNIAPAPLAIISAAAMDRPYNGTSTVTITDITLGGILYSDHVSVDMTGLTGILSSSNAGDYTTVSLPVLTLAGDDADNYTLLRPSGEVPTNVTISKTVATEAMKSAAGETKYGASGTVDLSAQLADGYQLGDISTTDSDNVLSGEVTLDDGGILSFAFVNDAEKINKTATVTVPVTSSTNYNTYSIEVTLTVLEKFTQTVSFAESTVPKTYGDAVFTNVATTTGDGTIAYSSSDADVAEVNSATGAVTIKKAGSTTITATAAETTDYKGAAATYELIVNKAALTVKPKNISIYNGAAMPTPEVEYLGLKNGDAGATVAELTSGTLDMEIRAADGTTALADTKTTGTYQIVFTGTPVFAASDKYEFTTESGTLTISTRPSSGGGSYTPPVQNLTVPISGDDNTIHVDAEVSGDKATVDEVDLYHLDTVIGDHVDTGTVTIDFSGLNSSKPITTVEIPSNVVKEIAEAVSDPNNDTHSFEVILSDGTSIEFDAVALGEKAAQADGKDITISIEHHDDAELTSAQKNAVGDRPAYDINVTSGGKHISDMGGKISVHLPYELAEGEDPDSIVVFYVDEHGNRERCETSYDPIKKRVNWKTDHLSLYMIDHCPSAAFADLNVDAWYHEATDYVIANGMMAGYGETFGPNDSITRGQIVTILHRLEDAPVVNYLMTYEDVAQEKYYAEAIRWATSEGIVAGYGNGKFGPDDPITRQQLATILWRFSQYKGYNVSVGEDTNILFYEDAFDISEYAIPAMQWACGAGVMGGYNDGSLKPLNNATRAHLAKMLMNYLEK